MTSPPAFTIEPSVAAPGIDPAAAIAAQLDIDLPEACLPGVALNAALLLRHWAALRQFRVPRS